MRLCIISGSQRSQSNSIRVAKEISELEVSNKKFEYISIVDVSEVNLKPWDEGVWDGDPSWSGWFKLRGFLREFDAFIIVTPEWAGMVPPSLKNLLLLCGGEELGHKPCLLVSISTGRGGTNPIHELRATGYKNNHICFIPDHIILRHLDSNSKCLISKDKFDIFEYHILLLSEYSLALKGLRDKNIVNHDKYKYGMS
ncbi:NADPH-dependent FMN reductase [Vibrio maritimus]